MSPQDKRLLLDQYLKWIDFDGVFILSPDWTVDIPLWPQSEAIDDLIPESLQEKLTTWQSIFDVNYMWSEQDKPERWLSNDAKEEWERAVPDLVAELTSVLEGKARLIVDLWPITPSGQNRELQDYRKAAKRESDRWQRVLKKAGFKLSWQSGINDATGKPIEWDSVNGLDEP